MSTYFTVNTMTETLQTLGTRRRRARPLYYILLGAALGFAGTRGCDQQALQDAQDQYVQLDFANKKLQSDYDQLDSVNKKLQSDYDQLKSGYDNLFSWLNYLEGKFGLTPEDKDHKEALEQKIERIVRNASISEQCEREKTNCQQSLGPANDKADRYQQKVQQLQLQLREADKLRIVNLPGLVGLQGKLCQPMIDALNEKSVDKFSALLDNYIVRVYGEHGKLPVTVSQESQGRPFYVANDILRKLCPVPMGPKEQAAARALLEQTYSDPAYRRYIRNPTPPFSQGRDLVIYFSRPTLKRK